MNCGKEAEHYRPNDRHVEAALVEYHERVKQGEAVDQETSGALDRMSKSSYPGLFDLANEKLYPLLGSASFVIGRSETADLTVLWGPRTEAPFPARRIKCNR
jgi:hypothetical protein